MMDRLRRGSGACAGSVGRVLALCLAWCLALAAPAVPAFDLQGHRGARGLAPENTLPAFARALSIGVTTLELDVGLTQDGVLVVSHDPALNPDITRGPDGAFLAARGPLIWASTAQALQRYDVGRINPASRYAQTYAAQQPVDGTRIPRLAEVFALAARAGAHDVRFNIETKIDPRQPEATAAPEPFARALVAAIREAGLTRRATIQSFDWRTLQVVQREAPEIDTVYLSAQQRWLDNIGAGNTGAPGATPAPGAGAAATPTVSWTAGLRYADHGSVPKMVKAASAKVWSPHFGDLTPALREEARALGLPVVVWTVNEPAAIARMLDLGVDGIISDRPDLVRQEMARRGMPLPPPRPVP
jgi:glycerophosphoryl diester phosphodiesterase